MTLKYKAVKLIKPSDDDETICVNFLFNQGTNLM